jgi:orotate phosphoribosyltransferase
MNKKAIAELLLDIKAVTINVEAPYHYRSGIISPIYCDNRLIISFPEERKKIINGFLNIIESLDSPPEIIAGTATAAIPFAAWVADKLDLPMIYVRSGQKGYGKERQIEGRLEKGQRVLFAEDLITTGGGVISAVDDVIAGGGDVVGVATIFEYGLPVAEEVFKKQHLPRWSLADFVSIVDVMTDRGDLSDENREAAITWQIDPKGWGKKMGFE